MLSTSILNPNMRKAILTVCISILLGAVLFIYVYYSEAESFEGVVGNLQYLALSILITLAMVISLRATSSALTKFLSWKSNMASRFSLGLFSNIIIAVTFLMLGGIVISGLVENNWQLNELWDKYYSVATKLLILAVAGSLIYSIFHFALYSYHQYSAAQIDVIKGERKQMRLQFDALRSQLSPHYLFNCLNTISSLIYKDSALAEDFIRRLAETYKYILSNDRKSFVNLQEEVNFLKSYHYLLKVRFESNLHLEVNLPDNIMGSKIPPLTLQMLMENAVKHNIISSKEPLTVYISAIDNTDIKVTNTKTKTPSHVDSFNIGLENIKKRYSYFTQRKISITDGQNYSVKLPVIQDIEMAKI